LTGSPNGVGAAYLLLQHKRQLGKMFIHKVRIFKSDSGWVAANLLFYVQDIPPSDKRLKKRRSDHEVELRIVEKRKVGKSLVREHMFRAKL